MMKKVLLKILLIDFCTKLYELKVGCWAFGGV